MLKFIKSRFMGVKEPETKNEVHTNVIAPITQKLIDIRDDIYNIIKDIKDPEFNNTLEELKVVSSEDIDLFENIQSQMIFIKILWAPTVEHCKFASHIGLSIRLKLQHELSGYDSFKIDILIKDNKHLDYKNCNVKNMRKINISICKVNKQINDKERYFAAQENQELMKFIMDLIKIVE